MRKQQFHSIFSTCTEGTSRIWHTNEFPLTTYAVPAWILSFFCFKPLIITATFTKYVCCSFLPCIAIGASKVEVFSNRQFSFQFIVAKQGHGFGFTCVCTTRKRNKKISISINISLIFSLVRYCCHTELFTRCSLIKQKKREKEEEESAFVTPNSFFPNQD